MGEGSHWEKRERGWTVSEACDCGHWKCGWGQQKFGRRTPVSSAAVTVEDVRPTYRSVRPKKTSLGIWSVLTNSPFTEAFSTGARHGRGSHATDGLSLLAADTSATFAGAALFNRFLHVYGTNFTIAHVCLVIELNGSRTLLSSLGNKREADLQHRFPSLVVFSCWFTSKIESVVEMVEYVHSASNKAAPNVAVISIEFEHPLDEPIMNKLVAFGNLFFVSKDFASVQGWTTMHDCVTMFQDKYDAYHSSVICPWGEKGVAVKCGTFVPFPCTENNGTVIELPAHFPSNGRVVDTLAAGDCFVAGTVHFLNVGDELRQALIKATFLAGESVGQRGLMGLKCQPMIFQFDFD
ncbi:hypothetical protein niasHS_007061 [Heterodera schachtii]|uniref:Carbohydrate kinase PfkB domain-containing protein n=1 Tax=Heterodera schachtii TaxID=97005 RepID=A0ABD2JFF0_HETSC